MSHRSPQNPPRRSRSPVDRSYHHKRHRSPHSHHHHHHSSKRSKPATPAPLPLQASPLSKTHYEHYKPMFSLYLDIQKQKVLEELPEDEVRGRWKSFVGKWYASSPAPSSQIPSAACAYQVWGAGSTYNAIRGVARG